MHSLSIVIPAYNEESRLPATLARVSEWMAGRALSFCEIVVVDDGSSDDTAAAVERETRANAALRLLRNPGNRGKGYAVRQGMLNARGEWILYTDADLSTPIEEVEKLYTAALAQQAVVAIGSRALDRSLVSVHQPAIREYSGRFFNLVMRALTGLPFHDTQCGFKLYRSPAGRVVFSRQQLDGFSFDVEDLYIAKHCGLKAIEVPVRWANVEGTKVSLAQGLRSFSDLIKIRRFAREGKYNCEQ
ncbi:MAG: dolichyl-phosphate beta-glucosyltransferase [Bryobacteraceae bacterium]